MRKKNVKLTFRLKRYTFCILERETRVGRQRTRERIQNHRKGERLVNRQDNVISAMTKRNMKCTYLQTHTAQRIACIPD